MLSHLPVRQVQETVRLGSRPESALRGQPPSADVTRLLTGMTSVQ